MKTLVVLSAHPGFAAEVTAALNPDEYRVIGRATVEDAEPLLVHGFAEACVVDVETLEVQAIWLLERLQRRGPKCPILVYAGQKQAEWEEEAYLRGASHVLPKPVRARMLNSVLDRLLKEAPATTIAPARAFPQRAEASPSPESAPSGATASHTLGLLRNFSGILSHSLDAEGMLTEFLLLLREILSINRAAIFLRQPFAVLGPAATKENRGLRSAASLGISPGLLQHLELSLESGIGGQVLRLSRILRRFSEDAQHDIESQKEFELLGCQVAVPILDRESLLGVAVFDSRITGEPLLNSELQLIFHLLEQLALAVKNIWLHDQLAGNHEMLADVLRELNSACVVVSRELVILHANKMARRCFARGERKGPVLEFSDLPTILGAKVYQALKTGSACPSFRYVPEDTPDENYNVNVVPFHKQPGGMAGAVLLTLEDVTQSERLRRLEVEASNLRLVRTMADRMTHEIGNAMVPLSTHQQLLTEKWRDGEFRTSLDNALSDGVKRVSRLINQMRFLARDAMPSQETMPVSSLIEEAYQEACKFQPAKASQFKYEGAKSLLVTGERAALKHAFSEVILNALQANPADPKTTIRVKSDSNGSAAPALKIEVQDNGPGFSGDIVAKAADPFFTTRNVGLGLGFTVSRKVFEAHGGKLEIVPTKEGENGLVRISLPVASPTKS